MSRTSTRRTAGAPRPALGIRLLHGTSGVLAGGLVALALILLAGWLVTTRTGSPGPGTGMLVGHGLAAVAAVGAQIVADRRPDRTGALAALGVLVLSAVVVGVYWLA